MNLLKIKKDKNNLCINFLGIKIKHKIIKENRIPKAQITKQQLQEKETFYNNLKSKILEDINLYKDIKVDKNTPKQKLENYRISSSLLDPMGCVIFKDDEIYRGVKPQSVDHAIELYESGLLQILAENGLIPKTEITNYYTEDFPLILKHKKVDMVAPQFWSFSMLKDVTINMLLINEIALHFGYQLIDGHPYNSTIHQGKPIFIDIGSFIKKDKSKEEFINEIHSLNLIVLLMKSLENSFFANKYFQSLIGGTTIPNCPITKSMEFIAYLNNFKKAHLKSSKLYRSLINSVFDKKILKPEYIDLLFSSLSKNSLWHNYSYSMIENIEKLQKTNNRYTRILELLDQFSPDAESSLDLAGNAAVMSYLISKSKNYKSIISTDYDEAAVDYGYHYFKDTNIKHYLLNFISAGSTSAIPDLIKSDVVLGLAVTHHLLLTQHNNIETMFSRIKRYSNKYVYIEFCPLGLYSSKSDSLPDIPQWYTEEWFEENFKKHFKLLHKETLAFVKIGNEEKKHRVMFIGQIK